MADLERQVVNVPAEQHTNIDIESLPALFGKLGDDVMTLIDAKLGLLKVELKEDASVYARNIAFISVGGVIAAIGFAFVNIAIAFFVSTFFESFTAPVRYALGFIITGLVYLIIGGALIYVFKNRMTSRSPVPHRSVEEIRKDKQWLKNETQG